MKTALVTGGNGDIGRACATALIGEGYRVAILDLDADATAKTAAEIGAQPLCADVRDEAAIAAALDGLEQGLDVVVNNAGIGRFAPLLDIAVEDFRLVTEVNLVGAFIVARAAARRMVARGGGSIVNITSINAVTAGPGSAAYPPAKAGLAKLSELMALEWGPLGLRVNAVGPGFIDAGMSTPFFQDEQVKTARRDAVPTRRLGTARDVADAVCFLVSDKASYINGHHLIVDGGVSLSLLSQLPRSRK